MINELKLNNDPRRVNHEEIFKYIKLSINEIRPNINEDKENK